MRETLIIRLQQDALAQHADVLVLDQSGNVAASHALMPWLEITPLASGRRVQVLVPGSDVVLTQVSIPSQSRQRILRAIPYALEEQFASDVSDLHFALGSRLADGAYPVAVVSRACMDIWLKQLQECDIHPDTLIPEMLALEYTPDSWSLWLDEQWMILRNGAYQGVVFEASGLDLQLQLSLQDSEQAPAQINLWSDNAVGLPDESLLADCEIQHHQLEPDQLLKRLNPPADVTLINLLQGSFSRSEQLGKLLRPWRSVAALLVVALLLSIGQEIALYKILKAEKIELAQQMRQEYKRAFPQAKRIVNPKVQMEQGLKKIRRGSPQAGNIGFLELMAQMGSVLQKQQGVQLNGSSFRDGRLDLDLVVDNLQILDDFKQALEVTKMLQVEIQSATSDAGQKVQGRIRIRGRQS
ncbi:MAG: type II secretion system protein GspL [Gammaproteobacteria bacterium]|nr:type II secretion system protein GspL [Gammaproteobacteria bacterium]